MRYAVAGLTYLDNNGSPLSGGKLFFYESGTLVAKNTYSGADETIPNTNPVLLDAAGRQPDIFFSGQAKIILTDVNDVQIDVADPVGESAVSGSFGDWVVTVEYDLGDTVTGPNGNYYVSIVSANVGNNPTISPTKWQQMLYVYVYNSAFSYESGDVTLSSGVLYVSLVGSNIANTPSNSPAQWRPLNTQLWNDIGIKTANFNAANGRSYLIDTVAGAFTMTLPPTPTVGDVIGFTDYGGAFGTFNFTIGRNGSKIMNSTTDLICDISYFSASLIYTAGRGWVLK